MTIQQLKLANFKNYKHLTIDFSLQLNCFVGKNGMGKTNLLEAIYYLCMTKSSFGINDRQVVRRGADFFRIEGQLGNGDKIVAKIQVGKLKVMERNDVPYQRLTEHVGMMPVVMMVPDDTLLVSEGSEDRRRFVDNTLSQLDGQYLRQLMQYNKVLKQRNAALKEFHKSGYFDDRLIDAYDQQLIEPANFVYAARRDFINGFVPLFLKYYQTISNDAEQVGCAYVSKLENAKLEDLLVENRQKDRILQRTTVGVHKDDLKFTLAGMPLRRFGSQGQLKSYVLSLKLAQFELLKQQKKKTPLLLLDDIFDKLDQYRVEQLISLLLENDFGQIFITDTHETRLEKIVAKHAADYRKFTISEGAIEKAIV